MNDRSKLKTLRGEKPLEAIGLSWNSDLEIEIVNRRRERRGGEWRWKRNPQHCFRTGESLPWPMNCRRVATEDFLSYG